MKQMPLSAACAWWLLVPTGFAAAQTPVLPPPVVRPPVVADAIVPQRVPPRIADGPVPIVPPTTVSAPPLVREAVVAPVRTVTWWDAFGKLRYGYYNDG